MGLSKFKRYLKDDNDSALLISSGRSFQSLITAGKKELLYKLVLHAIVLRLFGLRRV